MVPPLLSRHRHEHRVIDARRQLLEHFGLAPAQQHGCQCLAKLIQILITNDPARFIRGLVGMPQAPGRAQSMLIDILNDGYQLFEPVFQRRPGQHNGVGTLNALQGARGNRVPVLDPLRLIDNHDIGGPGADRVQIAGNHIVVDDFAESARCVLRSARGSQAADHQRLAVAEALNFFLPLMFERRGTDDQHAFHAEMPRQQLGRCDGLNGLSQAHLVTDQAAPRARRKQCTFRLIGIKVCLYQRLQGRAVSALRVRRIDNPLTLCGIAHLGHKTEHILVTTHLVAAALRLRQKPLQLRVVRASQHSRRWTVEQQLGGSRQYRRTFSAGSKPNLPFTAIMQIEFAVGRMKAPHQRLPAAALCLQLPEHKFNVLADPEVIGGEIRAGAEILANLSAANSYAVTATAARVGDGEFREYRFVTEIFIFERLRASKLPAQLPLPRLHFEASRSAEVRDLRLARFATFVGPGTSARFWSRPSGFEVGRHLKRDSALSFSVRNHSRLKSVATTAHMRSQPASQGSLVFLFESVV